MIFFSNDDVCVSFRVTLEGFGEACLLISKNYMTLI